jgi:hypothetical protein
MIKSSLAKAVLSLTFCAPWLFPSSARAGIAWAWAQSETGSFTADPNFSFNDAGGSISISQTGTGAYSVTFEGQELFPGNVQVMPYGTSDRICTIVSWGGNTVNLKCWAPNGTAMNSRFVVTFINYQDESGGPSTGFYLWNNLPSSDGTPALTYQWSSQPITNGSQSIDRTGVGVYDIFHSWTGSASPVVTAYSSSQAIYCTAEPVIFQFGAGTQVRCFDASGAPVDSRFSLSVSTTSLFGFQASGKASEDGGSITIPSNPNPGTPTVVQETTGVFRARFPSLIPFNKSMAMVSSMRFPPIGARLVISGWGPFGNGTEVVARCFLPSNSALSGACRPIFAYGTTQP